MKLDTPFALYFLNKVIFCMLSHKFTILMHFDARLLEGQAL